MTLTVAEADRIMLSEKRLIPPLDWQAVPNRVHKSPQHKIECRVEVGGAIKRGVFFRSVIFPAYPNTMSFQLEVDQETSRQHIVLFRLDVCPTNAHTNPMNGTDELSGLFFAMGETHEHHYSDNLVSDGSRIRASSDAFARKIVEPPSSFSSCVNYICDMVNLQNCIEIQKPMDQGFLL
jgi:hypothetical protein